uniref:cDNA n=1 Tax=Haemonchus contortus TaxID=6289 RepID=A0A7I5EA04_HAECO
MLAPVYCPGLRQAAPCLPVSRAAPLLVASTRQHHNILQAHDSSGILPWPQGKQHHAFQSHEQHHFSWPAHGSTTISCVLMTAPSYCPGSQGKQHHAFQSHEQHHFSWPAHGSTTISCGLMLAPVILPWPQGKQHHPSSLTSSTTSHGQHAAAPPYPAGS